MYIELSMYVCSPDANGVVRFRELEPRGALVVEGLYLAADPGQVLKTPVWS
jgi:hypothetical protein